MLGYWRVWGDNSDISSKLVLLDKTNEYMLGPCFGTSYMLVSNYLKLNNDNEWKLRLKALVLGRTWTENRDIMEMWTQWRFNQPKTSQWWFHRKLTKNNTTTGYDMYIYICAYVI